jgi:hypothetical protein
VSILKIIQEDAVHVIAFQQIIPQGDQAYLCMTGIDEAPAANTMVSTLFICRRRVIINMIGIIFIVVIL